MPVSQSSPEVSLIWVFSDPLAQRLDAASWLEMTRELRDLGWDVALVCAGPPDQNEINGVSITPIPKPHVYLISQVIFHIRVLRFIIGRWKNTKVILFHQMSAPWLLPLRWLRALSRRQLPIIVMDTRTAPMIPTEIASLKDRLRTTYDDLMNWLANHLADGQTAITIRMAQMMGIPESQLLGVWPSGVVLEPFAAAGTGRDWELVNKEVRLVYIGALHVQRNLMNFCRAIESANAAGKSFKFTMVGWGTARDDLAAYASETDGRIEVLPPIPHDEIPDLLARAHIGVLPFPDQERFRVSSPIKLFEFMASGLPVLVTRIACHTDVIGSANFALWSEGSEPASFVTTLNQVWERRHELPEMGKEAALASRNWTWKASAMKLDQALKKGVARQTKLSTDLP